MEKLKKETIEVNSVAVKKAKYNYDNSRLKLTFVNGKQYNYDNVPIDKFILDIIIRLFIYLYIKSIRAAKI